MTEMAAVLAEVSARLSAALPRAVRAEATVR